MSKIDLGRKPQDLVTILTSDDRNSKRYPSLHIDDIQDSGLADIPDTGECTIKYKVIHRTHSEHDVGGKKQHRCSLTLEVHSIEPPPAKTSKKKNGAYGDDARKAANDYFKDK